MYSILYFYNFLLFKFIKLYLHDDLRFNKFIFSRSNSFLGAYGAYGAYGTYGTYGGIYLSANQDISNNKYPLIDEVYTNVSPTDPLDTIFMFHDYKLTISNSNYDSFIYNINAVSSIMFLSKNYMILNFLTIILSFPLIVGFTIFCIPMDALASRQPNIATRCPGKKHKLEHYEKHLNIIKLESNFRTILQEYYNSEISYDELVDQSKVIFIHFKDILTCNQ